MAGSGFFDSRSRANGVIRNAPTATPLRTAPKLLTEEIVRRFLAPNEKQRKVLEGMKTTAPVSRWRMKLLNLFGSA